MGALYGGYVNQLPGIITFPEIASVECREEREDNHRVQTRCASQRSFGKCDVRRQHFCIDQSHAFFLHVHTRERECGDHRMVIGTIMHFPIAVNMKRVDTDQSS